MWISHFLDLETSEYGALARRVEQVFLRGPLGCAWFRTRAEIESMFRSRELVEPGLTLCAQWWAEGPQITLLRPIQHCLVGGVGGKLWPSREAHGWAVQSCLQHRATPT
jgi:hypothetical protein